MSPSASSNSSLSSSPTSSPTQSRHSTPTPRPPAPLHLHAAQFLPKELQPHAPYQERESPPPPPCTPATNTFNIAFSSSPCAAALALPPINTSQRTPKTPTATSPYPSPVTPAPTLELQPQYSAQSYSPLTSSFASLAGRRSLDSRIGLLLSQNDGLGWMMGYSRQEQRLEDEQERLEEARARASWWSRWD